MSLEYQKKKLVGNFCSFFIRCVYLGHDTKPKKKGKLKPETKTQTETEQTLKGIYNLENRKCYGNLTVMWLVAA